MAHLIYSKVVVGQLTIRPCDIGIRGYSGKEALTVIAQVQLSHAGSAADNNSILLMGSGKTLPPV